MLLLLAHADLLLYPILTVIAVTLLIAVTAAGILLWVNFDLSVFSRLSAGQQTALTFLYYVVSYCLGIYTNTALITVVLQLLSREPMDMAAGWRVANERLLSILGYALIMATVGMVLRLILKPIGRWGSVVAPTLTRITAFTFIGLAWNLIPYFVVPVLIAENPGSMPAIRRSSAIVRQRWGEDVVVNASVWLIFALPLLLVLLLGMPAIGWAYFEFDEWGITWTVYAVTMLVLLTFLFKMAMDAIFAAVAYRYATTGEIPDRFYEEDLRVAFINRPSRMVNAVRRWFARRFQRPKRPLAPTDNSVIATTAYPTPDQAQSPTPDDVGIEKADNS
jgi:hypothetical protein